MEPVPDRGQTAVMARERGKPRSPMPSKVPSGIGGLGTVDTRGRTGMTSGGVRMTNAKNAVRSTLLTLMNHMTMTPGAQGRDARAS